MRTTINNLRSACLAYLLLAAAPVQGQQARAWLDSSTILIGQQVKLHLELKHLAGEDFTWPSVADTLGPLEVIEKSEVSGNWSSDSSEFIRRQSMVITCFDSGYYALPPFVFKNKRADGAGHAVETLPLLLAVHTVEVDTSQAIRDIKAPAAIPFALQDLVPYLIGILLLAAACWLAYYLYQRRKRRAQKKPVRAAPTRPAHEIAMEALRKLEAEKYWQQGNFKAYYTGLTDILRSYIEHRWNVYAMEMTTDEILHYPIIYKLSSANRTQLKTILELADFVKFAKMIPVANENEQCLKLAYDFILDTRITAVAAAPKPAVNEKEEAAV